ncbi:MAG: SDR family oxidoreductase [Bacteroidales bacterium]|nr:SDR family oxidoreductase [Bacteroidales bacterium]
MLTALITGSSGGIGRATALALLSQKYRVIGISRTSAGIDDENFIELQTDLCDTEALLRHIESLSREYTVDVLINNAGVGFYGLHASLTPAMIHEMTAVNLEVPMLLSAVLLPQLIRRRGKIINISSVTAKRSENTHGAAYGATKAGLSSFGASLFAEVRKHGVGVINIHPDMTDTGLYRSADFGADTSDGCCLSPEDVAAAVIGAINAPDGVNLCDITVAPQYHRILRKKERRDD